MLIRSSKLALSVLLIGQVCYSSAIGEPRDLPGGLRESINYTPESSQAVNGFKKTMTTIFWVGEGATPDSGYIDNYGSYWDPNWMKNFGGVDTPSRRNGFLPARFMPKQNPFYVALPFAEVDREGRLKEVAKKIPGFGKNNEPLTRNRWIEIRYKGKSCFAQWQDVGPSEEDDFDWVFGSAKKPKNKNGLKAGLDISPATAHYLGIEDSAHTEWRFVDAVQVPDGPWKQIVTK
jgi:hypothetical protein